MVVLELGTAVKCTRRDAIVCGEIDRQAGIFVATFISPYRNIFGIISPRKKDRKIFGVSI